MQQVATPSPSSTFRVKAVLFDLDGTLVHSAPDLAAAVNRMLQDLGRATQPQEQVLAWVGNGMTRLVQRALTGSMDGEAEPELFERALASFKTHYSANLAVLTRPYPGAIETLELLRATKVALGCVTNKAAMFTLPLLRQMGLAKYFAVVVCGDTTAARKPDPTPLRQACAQLGIDAGEALLVGDSVYDVQAARAAGMPVICVSYGYHRGADIRALAPDAVVDSLAQVTQYLRLHQV